MKLFIILFLLFLTLVTPSYAHFGGTPVFTINGEYVVMYANQPVPSHIQLPPDSDVAPKRYVTNQALEFEVDIAKITITPTEIFKKTTFIWDFGDGTEKQSKLYGITNTHAYQKSGTYLLTVSADYKPAGFDMEPQIIEAVMITVLPVPENSTLIPAIIIIIALVGGIIILRRKKR